MKKITIVINCLRTLDFRNAGRLRYQTDSPHKSSSVRICIFNVLRKWIHLVPHSGNSVVPFLTRNRRIYTAFCGEELLLQIHHEFTGHRMDSAVRDCFVLRVLKRIVKNVRIVQCFRPVRNLAVSLFVKPTTVWMDTLEIDTCAAL